jgi:ornithine cyclodeaminase/alanine dehydrogenase-like protein (mu-crystallin family)
MGSLKRLAARNVGGRETRVKVLGLAAEDLAAAAHVYSKAKGQGAGTWAEF